MMWYLVISVFVHGQPQVAGWVDTFDNRPACEARIKSIRASQDKTAKTKQGLTYKDFQFLCDNRAGPPKVVFDLMFDNQEE